MSCPSISKSNYTVLPQVPDGCEYVIPLLLRGGLPSPMQKGEKIQECLVESPTLAFDACGDKTLSVGTNTVSIAGIYPCAEEFIAAELAIPTSPIAIAVMKWAKANACEFRPYIPDEAVEVCGVFAGFCFHPNKQRPAVASAPIMSCDGVIIGYGEPSASANATVQITNCDAESVWIYASDICIPKT